MRRIQIQPGWTAYTVKAFRKFGKPIPWEDDGKKADIKSVAPSYGGPHVDFPAATAKTHTGRTIPVDEADAALDRIEIRPGFTAYDLKVHRLYGKPLPWEKDEKKADIRLIAPSYGGSHVEFPAASFEAQAGQDIPTDKSMGTSDHVDLPPG